MQVRFQTSLRFLSVFAFLCLSALVHAETGEALLSRVSSQIASSLSDNSRHCVVRHLDQLVALELDHAELSILDDKQFLAHKYLMSHWRFHSMERLVNIALTTSSPDEFETALLWLRRLNASLEKEYASKLWSRSAYFGRRQYKEVHRLISETLGQLADVEDLVSLRIWEELTDRAKGYAGPDSIPIPPILPAIRYGRDGWLGLPQSDLYTWHQSNSVEFRGITVMEGDVVTIDHALIYDGTNTSFSTRASRFTHAGQVVMMPYRNALIPAVLDIHPLGMRVVPLGRFLSAKFARYAEVYRRNDHVEFLQKHAIQLRQVARRLVDHPIGYDFNGRSIPESGFPAMLDSGSVAVVCSTISPMVFNTIGAPIFCEKSKLTAGAQINVGNMGLTGLSASGEYLTPTDLARSTSLFRVGVIDNGFIPNVLRELLVGNPEQSGSLGQRISDLKLEPDPRRMPWKTRAVYRLITYIKNSLDKRTPMGKFLIRVLRTFLRSDLAHLPQAPAKVLATVAALNTTLENTAMGILGAMPAHAPGIPAALRGHRMSPDCARLLEDAFYQNAPFDIREVSSDPLIQSALTDALDRAGLGAFFNGPLDPI